MKKNMIMRFASVLLVATLISTCAISGTFAKYTSSATGSDAATVAKWAFNVGDTDIASNAFTFNLFNTVKDSNGTDNETDISNTDGTIIAPGTSGSFDLVLTNESQVDAQYAIDYTVTNANNIPIKFSTNGTDWKDNINELNVAASDTTQLDFKGGTNDTDTITIHWKWAFDGDDTTLGKGGTATVTVSAKVTATQVD